MGWRREEVRLEEVKPDGLELQGFLEMEVIFEVMTGKKTAREREAERQMLCVLTFTIEIELPLS